MSDSARINLTNCVTNPFDLHENLNVSNVSNDIKMNIDEFIFFQY